MKSSKSPKALPLRLEPGLRAWLEVKARENKRSMNGEVTILVENYRASTQKSKEPVDAGC